MTFWGKRIVPNKYRNVRKSDTGRRLRVTRATLDYYQENFESSPRKTSVWCYVGDKGRVIICTFTGHKESISLDLEFDLTEKVRFLVKGKRAVTLCGYFLECGNDNQVIDEHAEEDIDYTESESIDDDDSENEYDFYDSFIDDSDLTDNHNLLNYEERLRNSF